MEVEEGELKLLAFPNGCAGEPLAEVPGGVYVRHGKEIRGEAIELDSPREPLCPQPQLSNFR